MGKSKWKGKSFIGNVPEGWVGCPQTSTGCIDDRFFVFKTPLKPELNAKVPPSERFSIDNVFQALRRMNNSRVGLWIDLTNTSRYYDASEIGNRGVEYHKFASEGHGKAPPLRVIRAFCNLVNDFFRRNKRDYVGVHCTHGFNRTGFLICAYLIRCRRYPPEDAVLEFARFRAPGIYRQMYVDELYAMSSSPRRPLLVTQPLWLQQGRNPAAARRPNTTARASSSSSSSASNSQFSTDVRIVSEVQVVLPPVQSPLKSSHLPTATATEVQVVV